MPSGQNYLLHFCDYKKICHECTNIHEYSLFKYPFMLIPAIRGKIISYIFATTKKYAMNAGMFTDKVCINIIRFNSCIRGKNLLHFFANAKISV